MSPKQLTQEEAQGIYSVKTYILNHLHEKFTIQQLSRKAALGEQKFKDGFQSLFGTNVGAFVHEARMHTAKFLLTETDKTIKKIASLVGYSTTENFLRAFKKKFGITAGSLRKS